LRRDIKKKMAATIGILLEQLPPAGGVSSSVSTTIAEDQEEANNPYRNHGMRYRPIYLSVRPSWMGSISRICVFETSNASECGTVALPTPFAPGRETGFWPRKYNLELQVRTLAHHLRGYIVIELKITFVEETENKNKENGFFSRCVQLHFNTNEEGQSHSGNSVAAQRILTIVSRKSSQLNSNEPSGKFYVVVNCNISSLYLNVIFLVVCIFPPPFTHSLTSQTVIC
jgi:hypothetical protein